MKKIDLHIHTVSSISDYDFEFSLPKLKEYVEELSIDCIAITNHNLFDLEQFKEIDESLPIDILPGIEIDLEKGHLLLIAENTELEDFESKCLRVKNLINSPTDYITIEQFREIFADLTKYLLIPHYDKKPIIKQHIIEELGEFISAGEVASPKKFKYCINNENSLVPVLFSDLRFKPEMTSFSPRQTFIDIDDTSLRGIKTCFLDKNKVFLTEEEGHKFFQVFENGQKLSNGLNVILGERSSGKSYTLKKISENFKNIKYIRQFELLETDEEKDKKKFNDILSSKQNSVSENYLKEFKEVVEDVVKIDRRSNEKEIEVFIDSLLKVAKEEEKKDVFSNCVLFNESKYIESDNDNLKKLIYATSLLIENVEHRDVINQHIQLSSLKALIVDLMKKYNQLQELNQKKLWVNSIISNIKDELKSNTASSSISDINFYQIQLEKEKINKFETLSKLVKTEKVIEKKDVRRFSINASTKKFSGAQELLNKSGRKLTFSNAYQYYEEPIKFLEELKNIELLPETDFYKYFVDIEYKILNEYEIEVSGGERSEFNLLEKIQNAHHFDMLLIDEPESSFDNLFLKNEVNEQIREIAKTVPVVIVTHNNTVGASIRPDYLLYTRKEIKDKKPVFKIYSGYPSDKNLKTIKKEEINNYNIMLNCLEAGDIAYSQRGRSYDILKN